MFGYLCSYSHYCVPMATEAWALTKSTLLRTSVDAFEKALKHSSLDRNASFIGSMQRLLPLMTEN